MSFNNIVGDVAVDDIVGDVAAFFYLLHGVVGQGPQSWLNLNLNLKMMPVIVAYRKHASNCCIVSL